MAIKKCMAIDPYRRVWETCFFKRQWDKWPLRLSQIKALRESWQPSLYIPPNPFTQSLSSCWPALGRVCATSNKTVWEAPEQKACLLHPDVNCCRGLMTRGWPPCQTLYNGWRRATHTLPPHLKLEEQWQPIVWKGLKMQALWTITLGCVGMSFTPT